MNYTYLNYLITITNILNFTTNCYYKMYDLSLSKSCLPHTCTSPVNYNQQLNGREQSGGRHLLSQGEQEGGTMKFKTIKRIDTCTYTCTSTLLSTLLPFFQLFLNAALLIITDSYEHVSRRQGLGIDKSLDACAYIMYRAQ